MAPTFKMAGPLQRKCGAERGSRRVRHARGLGELQAQCGKRCQIGTQAHAQQPHSWGVKELEGALRRSVGSGLLGPLTAVTTKVGRAVLVSSTGQTVLRGTPLITTALSREAEGEEQLNEQCK